MTEAVIAAVIFAVIFGSPVLAFLAVRIAARQDQRDFQREQGITHPKTNRWKAHSDNYQMQWIYGGVAVVTCLPLMLGLMSAVLHADVPVKDTCSWLEPWSIEWILLGCIWGSYL
jgi:uncharacterized membrane protein YkgB